MKHYSALALTIRDNKIAPVENISSVSYDFHNADYCSVVKFLASINWVNVLDERDVDNATMTLSHIFGHVRLKENHE